MKLLNVTHGGMSKETLVEEERRGKLFGEFAWDLGVLASATGLISFTSTETQATVA